MVNTELKQAINNLNNNDQKIFLLNTKIGQGDNKLNKLSERLGHRKFNIDMSMLLDDDIPRIIRFSECNELLIIGSLHRSTTSIRSLFIRHLSEIKSKYIVFVVNIDKLNEMDNHIFASESLRNRMIIL